MVTLQKITSGHSYKIDELSRARYEYDQPSQMVLRKKNSAPIINKTEKGYIKLVDGENMRHKIFLLRYFCSQLRIF